MRKNDLNVYLKLKTKADYAESNYFCWGLVWYIQRVVIYRKSIFRLKSQNKYCILKCYSLRTRNIFHLNVYPFNFLNPNLLPQKLFHSENCNRELEREKRLKHFIEYFNNIDSALVSGNKLVTESATDTFLNKRSAFFKSPLNKCWMTF